MDIDLFSEIIKDLILDNDEVTLPGLGTFVSEVMPSTFSDKGYTINPPYRKLSFRQRESGDGRLLVDFYSKANGTDFETSERILSEYISGLRSILQTRKVVALPGLGRLRATKENAFFFIADEDLDIYPYGVGLEPVSLKTHEETPEEVADGVAELRKIIDEPVQAPVAGNVTSTGSATEESPAVEESPVTREGPVVEKVTSTGSVTEETPAVEESPVTEESPVVEKEPVAEPVEATDQREASQTASQSASQDMSGEEPLAREERRSPVRRRKAWRTAAIVAVSAVGVLILALGIFVVLSRVAPDFIDSILYTPEELRIINY